MCADIFRGGWGDYNSYYVTETNHIKNVARLCSALVIGISGIIEAHIREDYACCLLIDEKVGLPFLCFAFPIPRVYYSLTLFLAPICSTITHLYCY